MEQKFILKPILIFLFIFIIDKIAFLPFIKKYIIPWNKIEPAIYESRQELFRILKNPSPPEQGKKNTIKIGLILGTSRSGWFDSQRITKTISDSKTFNFSAPLAGPAWHYYWLDKIIKSRIKIDYVILEADPLLFTMESLKYSLDYSFDPYYMIQHCCSNFRISQHQTPTFNLEETEEYILKNSFALYKYPIEPSTIRENFKEFFLPDAKGHPVSMYGYQFGRIFNDLIQDANLNRNGSIANPFQTQLSTENMERDAREAFHRLGLIHFQPANTQKEFFTHLLTFLAHSQIPTVIFRPPMSPILVEKMNQDIEIKKFQNWMEDTITSIRTNNPKEKIHYIDLTKDKKLKCQSYTDSVHLSGVCYSELTDLLANELKKGGLYIKNPKLPH